MTLQERADLYRKAFPKFQPLSVVETADGKQRLEGLWIMGQNYTVKSGYYGGYPHGYLDRVMSMFPDILCFEGTDQKKALHLFSGNLSGKGEFLTFDSNPELGADICGNAENLSAVLENRHNWLGTKKKFDLILADPPYSAEDAEHYGTPMVSRVKVLKECFSVLEVGGFLVWLDQVFPMFSKEEFHLAGTIGMIKSTNHRVRAVFIFQKAGGNQ